MANMTFKANLLPNSDLGQNLGAPNQRWNIYGKLNGSTAFAGNIPTAADTGSKALICPEFTSSDLTMGSIVYGTIENTNTATPASLTLNVNSTGAKPLKYIQNGIVSNIPAAGYLLANQTYQFHYDGTNWIIDNLNYGTDTTYEVLAASQNGTSASLVTTGEKYNWDNSGTVKSVQVDATSPVVSSTSTTQTDTLSTTISLADGYGDIKNPYAAKSGGYVLAGPVSLIGTKTRTSNLLDVNDSTITNAYINSSGGITNNANDRLGPFIAVTPGQDIYYTGIVGETSSASINRRLHVYTSNQTWIQQLAYQTLQIGDHWSVHGVVPSNGAYIRVSWGNTDTQVMISVGAPTQYEPYYNVIETQNDEVPTFRPLAASDIPTLDIVDKTTGTLAINRGGTGATTPAAAWANLGGGDIGKLNKGNASATATFLAQNGTWLTPPGTYTLPKATSSILGGITVGNGLSVNNGNVSVDWSNAPVQSVNGTTGVVVLSDLVIGSSHYNGSTTVTVSVTDLGLTAPMTFKGVTDTTIVDGANVSPVNITSGGIIGSLTPANGDVVLQKDEQIEYLYTGSAWTSLGIASSYSLSEHAHGHILNDGTMSTTAAVATGDHLLIADASDYNRIISAGDLTFDASAPQSALSRAGTWVNYLQLSGGTMTGALKTHGLIGTLDYDYGEILPTTAVEGQVFFQVSYGDEVEFKIPAGGTAGYALVKNSNADGDLKWQLIQANDKVAKAGDTMSGDLTISKASGSVAYRATRSDTGASVSLHVGSGGTNRGVYDYTLDKWIIYSDGTDARTQLKLYGAVWNDYAEFRKDNPEEVGLQMPGICVRELGDGKLERTMRRLERGCEIISDTFGFSIGQDKKNGINTPIASSGRVLAYIYEGRETARNHIGWPVCSGPNGTVSIMTEEEEEKYPSRIIGTISEIPDYDTWGDGSVIVNGRIWIRIR